MKYKLTVIKYENNENYEAEMAKWKESQDRYGNRNYGLQQNTALDEPRLEKITRSLEVFLSEEEYRKLRNEVMLNFD